MTRMLTRIYFKVKPKFWKIYEEEKKTLGRHETFISDDSELDIDLFETMRFVSCHLTLRGL